MGVTMVGVRLTVGGVVGGPGSLSLQIDSRTWEVGVLPDELQEVIAAWRSLTEAERVSRLREHVIDEVVGNMRMEGQPVSADWEATAREADSS